MQTIDDLLNDTLYQYIDREDLDPELSEDNWQGFLNMYQSIFAEEASDLAMSLMREYKLHYIDNKEATSWIIQNYSIYPIKTL